MANLISLNGIELTDQGRTFSEAREERSVSVELASGRIKKYIKGLKRTWQIQWQWLPGDASSTHDGLGGRDQIRAIAYSANTFALITRNTYGETDSYTVWVTDYDEELVRRDNVSGEHFYNVTLSLQEQ